MQVLYSRCAGLNVHKKTVSACISIREGGVVQQHVRTFATFTSDLLAMADWLKQHGIVHLAMEATGVYWRPVWAVLEGPFEQMLVNPQHIKAVPGRKTDTRDCAWSIQESAPMPGIIEGVIAANTYQTNQIQLQREFDAIRRRSIAPFHWDSELRRQVRLNRGESVRLLAPNCLAKFAAVHDH